MDPIPERSSSIQQATLVSISDFLNAVGGNYSVFLRSYSTPLRPGKSSSQLIDDALGRSVVLRTISEVTPTDVLSIVRASLGYAGDRNHGPDPATMRSEEFAALLSRIMKEVGALAYASRRIEKFSIERGHPAEPIFWDFAFLFIHGNEAIVFIGSSSD